MKKIEILNFQNLHIENAKITSKPFDRAEFEEEDALTVLFIRDPFEYFDYLVFDYLLHNKSLLFTQDIISHMKRLDNKAFLYWLDSLNFFPFHNPQTFQLDIRKRVPQAIENLESFDYVVPYEAIDIFLEKVLPGVRITKREEKKLIFSLSTLKGDKLTEQFIGKDIELYNRALELWRLVEENNFNSLNSLLERKRISQRKKEEKKQEEDSKKLQNYRGTAGKISENFIAGWVFHKEKSEKVTLEIYKNGKFLLSVKADKMREDLKKQHIHPIGECGFEVHFEEATFKKGDKVEVKILPDKIVLPLGKNIKEFLRQ